MSRKNILYNFNSIPSSPLSGNIIGIETVVSQFDIVTYLVQWSGGVAINGELFLEKSKDGVDYTPVDFGVQVRIDGSAGEHSLIVEEVGFKFLRPKYISDDPFATGTISVSVYATNRGA